MNKNHLLLPIAFLALLAVFSNAALALTGPVQLKIDPAETVSDLNEKTTFHITIANNQNKADDFSLITEGPYLGWVTQPYILVHMNASETKTIDMILYPTTKRGTFRYTTFVRSISNPRISVPISYVIRIPPTYLLNKFTPSVTDNTLSLQLDMFSLKAAQYSFDFLVTDSSGKRVMEFSEKRTVKGTEAFAFTRSLPERFYTGTYTVTFKIAGTNMSGSGTFFIEPRHDVKKTIERQRDFMRETVTLYVFNNGNIDEKDYMVEEKTASTDFTGMVSVPAGCTETVTDKVCIYSFEKIAPGETGSVTYTLEFWPSYLQLGAGGLFILIAVFYSFFRITTPTINKRAVKKSQLKHSISLELKNPFFHHLKNAVIRDWVSPLADVIVNEIGSVKPVIRRSAAGTELIWRLGNINPKETRILNYNIKARIEGSLKMPRAFARFHTPKGKKFRVYSTPVTLK